MHGNWDHHDDLEKKLKSNCDQVDQPTAALLEDLKQRGKGGQTVGRTDDFGLQVVADRIHVHDLHATILHCLGLHHQALTYRHMGRDFRLTDVAGKIVKTLLA